MELSIHGGGKIHALMSLELNWFMLEELGEQNISLAVEQLIKFVFLKTLIILQKQQGFQDKVKCGVLNINLVEIYIQVSMITMYHVLSATCLPGYQFLRSR